MVTFNKKSFTVEIYTGTNPIEGWLELQKELSYVFSMLRQDITPDDGLWRLASLMEALLPDQSVAERMTEIRK